MKIKIELLEKYVTEHINVDVTMLGTLIDSKFLEILPHKYIFIKHDIDPTNNKIISIDGKSLSNIIKKYANKPRVRPVNDGNWSCSN